MNIIHVNGMDFDEAVLEARLNNIATLSGRNVIVYDDLTTSELTGVRRVCWVILCCSLFRKMFFGYRIEGSRALLVNLHPRIAANPRIMVVYQNALANYNRLNTYEYIPLTNYGVPLIHRPYVAPLRTVAPVHSYVTPRIQTISPVIVNRPMVQPSFIARPAYTPALSIAPMRPIFARPAIAAPIQPVIVNSPSAVTPIVSRPLVSTFAASPIRPIISRPAVAPQMHYSVSVGTPAQHATPITRSSFSAINTVAMPSFSRPAVALRSSPAVAVAARPVAPQASFVARQPIASVQARPQPQVLASVQIRHPNSAHMAHSHVARRV